MKSIFSLLLLFFVVQTLYSQYEFIENKGQWHENVLYKMNLNDGAIFFENNCLSFAFISQEDMNYSAAHHGSENYVSPLIKAAHAYKMNLKNSKPNPIVRPDLIKPDYNNYFIGNDPSKWASFVNKYGLIRYSDVYPGIDFVFYAMPYGLKYDIVLAPGADYNKIELEYQGADYIYIENGNLIINTTVNQVVEQKPYAYQIIKGDTIEIPCSYVLKNNLVSFKILGKYDKTKELIIDPTLVFSTYTGSTGDNWGFTATWDYNDNVYSGGIVFAVGYPTSVGAYQVNFAGGTAPLPWAPNYYGNGCDIGIIKYNSTGTQRLFATYLGGTTGQEMPHSLVVNEFNELVIMGTTCSYDFPTTPGAFQQSFAGGDSLVYDNVIGFAAGVDIFVAKLSENGSQLLGSTYVGGSKNDGLNFKIHYTHPDPVTGINYVKMHGNDSLYFNYGDGARGEVIVDKKGFIYVGTNTFSTDFPQGINPGYQTTGGGGQDGIVFKLNPNLTQLVWSSYLGGSQDDAIFSLSLTENEDVIVAGGTVSHNFPVTPSAYNTSHNGGSTDAFVSKLNKDGNLLLASTYFGSNVYDNAFFVRTDRYDYIYICGQTKAPGSQLIFNAAYNNPNSGQFITKFTNNLGSVIWSTRIGSGNGRPNISITAFAVDVCNRVYLSGWGREWVQTYYNAQGNYYTWADQFGTKGMPVTPDAIQTTTDGQDFYVAVLSEDASALEYASFFGELNYPQCGYSGRDHVDGGTSRFDKKGHIIQSVCASCGGCQHFPVSPNPGAWSTSNNSTNCNNAVFKIRIIENLAEASFDPVPAGCAPYTVNFVNHSQGTTFQWNFGDGSPLSNAYNPSHTYTQGGIFTVTLVVSDPASCNLFDTLTREIIVMDPNPTFLPDINICPGQQTIIGPNFTYPPGTTFQWQGAGLNNYNIQNPIASPSQTTNYLLVASSVCTDTVWQRVVVYQPNFQLTVSNDTMICPGGSVLLTANTNGAANTYQWSSNPSFNPILSTNQTFTVSPSANTTYYVRAYESTCNTFLQEQVNVTIHQFNYSVPPQFVICPGETTSLSITNNNPSDVLSYQWGPVSQIISGANTANPVVGPATNTTYYVTVTNQMGCTSTASTNVIINNVSLSAPQLTHNLCYGDCTGTASISATQGTQPFNFTWSTGQNGTQINGLCAGNYSVTLSDFYGCTTAANFTINQPPQLVSSFTNVVQPQCDGIGYGAATVVPGGGTPPYSYAWSYGGNQSTNNQLLTGTNYVTITDANGCSHVNNIFMAPPSDLVSSVQEVVNISCYGACDGSIRVQASLGTPPYNYVWSNGSFGDFITGLCPGIYTVTIIDAENCVTHQQQVVSQPYPLIATPTIISPIRCHGQTATISANITGGTMPYSVVWSNSHTGIDYNIVTAGTYQLTVTDDHSCTTTAEITVTQPDPISMQSSLQNQICDGVCNGEIYAVVSGGVQPYNFSWSNQHNGSFLVGLCSGNYSLTVSDANNCTKTQQYFVQNLNYVPDLSVSASDTVIFRGQNVGLYANSTSAGSYYWNNSQVLNNNQIQNPIATPIQDGYFSVSFRDSRGCLAADSVFVRVKEVICGEPYIFIPNAFTPNNDGINDFFKAYFPLNMVTELYLAVYDRWGNIIFETDNINSQGWDGTYKGEKLGTDVYVFMFRARCLDNMEYVNHGNVTLLR